VNGDAGWQAAELKVLCRGSGTVWALPFPAEGCSLAVLPLPVPSLQRYAAASLQSVALSE